MLSTGETLQNRYKVVRPLGRGGMGDVYEGEDTLLSCTVALKVCLSDPAAFNHEAQLLANLRHPALPVAHNFIIDKSRNILVMDFVAGDDLETLSKQRRGNFSLYEVKRWAEELFDVLDHLHNNPIGPIIHRDVKPSNLKLTPQGKLMLLDFGIAKGAAGGMQPSGTLVKAYTTPYAPLEQMDGGATDARSDVYSLAVTLYVLLTRELPPDARERHNSILSMCPDPLRPINRFRQDVPLAFTDALNHALKINIADRTACIADFKAEIQTSDNTSRYGKASFNQGLQLFKVGSYEDASRAFTESITREYRTPDSWYWLGLCNLELGGIDSKVEKFHEQIIVACNNVPKAQQGKVNLAGGAFDRVLSSSLIDVQEDFRSLCIRAHCWRGLIWKRLRDYRKARDSYINAIHLRPDWIEPRLCLIEIYSLLSSYRQVFLHYKALEVLQPGASSQLSSESRNILRTRFNITI